MALDSEVVVAANDSIELTLYKAVKGTHLTAEPDVRIAPVAERPHDNLAFRHDKQYVE